MLGISMFVYFAPTLAFVGSSLWRIKCEYEDGGKVIDGLSISYLSMFVVFFDCMWFEFFEDW